MLAPEEDEVSVHEDGLLHVWEHVGDEESLRGAQPVHVPHAPPLLHREPVLLVTTCPDTHLRVPDVVHAELQLVPVLAGPGQRGVDQSAEQILPVHYHVEVEPLPATIL